MGLSVEQAETLVKDMQDLLDVEAEVRPDYSGRGMFGSTVTAIVSDDPRAQFALAYVAGRINVIEEERGVSYPAFNFEDLPTRTDSMGRGVVIY